MKTILFICPYFGKLPEGHMKLWLLSCEKNPTIDWLILTDDRTSALDYPPNVKVVYTTLEEIKRQAQEKFDFPISLDRPYKLCDYKPAYGYIFSGYVEGYDYWGHCDMTDCIFGNLRKFLTDDFLSGADKFFFLGHMTIYRNAEEVNRRIFVDVKCRKDNLKQLLGSERNWAFDEINPYSINTIYMENGWFIKREDNMYADIVPLEKRFVLSQYDENYNLGKTNGIKHILEWKLGKLTDWMLKGNGELVSREIGYVHFQKRKIENCVRDYTHYYIVPNVYIDATESVSIPFVKRHTRFNQYLYLQYYKLRYKNLKFKIKRILDFHVSNRIEKNLHD